MSERFERQRNLPLRKAAEIATRNMRIRFTRSLLVMSGIALAIAFLSYVLITENQLLYIPERGSEQLFSSLKRQGILQDLGNADARIQTRWMVGMALVISFVGILNSMVMSVTERTREIGTMKCLGALDSFIVRVYLLESLIQGAAGTLVGLLVGVLLGFLDGLNQYGGEAWHLIPPLTLIKLTGASFLAGVFLTVAGALYPALHAARMQPIEALRTEV